MPTRPNPQHARLVAERQRSAARVAPTKRRMPTSCAPLGDGDGQDVCRPGTAPPPRHGTTLVSPILQPRGHGSLTPVLLASMVCTSPRVENSCNVLRTRSTSSPFEGDADVVE